MKISIGKYPKKDGDQKIKVQIDPWDTWSMDHTLAHIVTPMLKQLKETKHGAPLVDDEDVPDKLKSTASKKKKKNEWDTDGNWFKRWDYVLGEMIFAFESMTTDWEQQFYSGEVDIAFVPIKSKNKKLDGMIEMKKGPKDTFKVDDKGMKKYEERMQNGFRLFGKYYRSLWD